MICKDCQFYLKGRCRRYPPQVSHQVDRDGYGTEYHSNESFWPSVLEDEWCGEFKKPGE